MCAGCCISQCRLHLYPHLFLRCLKLEKRLQERPLAEFLDFSMEAAKYMYLLLLLSLSHFSSSASSIRSIMLYQNLFLGSCSAMLKNCICFIPLRHDRRIC